MVSPISNSLNAYFAASFSEVSRTTALTNPKTALEALKRITPDLPSGQIEELARQQQGQKGQQGAGRFNVGDESRQPTLGDFLRPKASLSPADEASLFTFDAATNVGTVPFAVTQQFRAQPASFFAETENDEAQQRAENQAQNQLSKRKQSYVAQLYAQASDITFSGESFVNQAA